MDSTHEIARHPVVLFDGVCNLCNYFVNFIIDRDTTGKIKFASLQSSIGQQLIKSEVPENYLGSVVFVWKGKIYFKSRAALEVFYQLGFPYSMLFGLVIVPTFISNWVYDFIAKRRYKWFGKQDTCRIPTPELRERFLDS